MSALATALADYHGLIEADLASAERQADLLAGLQRERRVLFGDRVAAHSLRPTLVTERTYARVQDAVYVIRSAILKVAAAHFDNPGVLTHDLGLRDWEMELAAIPSRSHHLSALSRLDAFQTDGGFKFVEVNGESPAGLGYVHNLAGIYHELPVFQAFTERWPVRYVSPMEHTVQMLVRTYHGEHGGTVDRPRIAIVDHLDVPTIHEFRIIEDYLGRLGYPCVVADPRELSVSDGWVVAGGERVDIVYRRLLTNEFWAIRDECPAFLEGYRAGKTCFLNSFRAKLAHKKAIFAFLTDARFTDGVLTPFELGTIRQHVPWTRRLREHTTGADGTPIDLVPHVRANRHRFVLKPNDEYGGTGVFLGFDLDERAWDDALNTALADGDYVVQEAVSIHREPFLVRSPDGWAYVPTVIDLDPYLMGPLLGGCLTRTSASNLANVTAGGGTLPMFILRNTFSDAD